MKRNKATPAPTGEVTIESLQLENETLTEVNNQLTSKVESLTDELNKRKNPGELLNDAKAKEKPVLPTESFEVNGTKYKFNTPVFVFNKQKIVAADAINNQDVLNELVAAGVGVISPA